MPSGCGRSLIIPRDLTVEGSELNVSPIPETASLCSAAFSICVVIWYGTVRYGMVWYGMVWYGMVWYGMVWYGMVWYYGMAW